MLCAYNRKNGDAFVLSCARVWCCALVRAASDVLIEGVNGCIKSVYLPDAQVYSGGGSMYDFYVTVDACSVFVVVKSSLLYRGNISSTLSGNSDNVEEMFTRCLYYL